MNDLPAVDPATHRELPYGRYWACQMPERPGDQHTSWGEGCQACLTHLAAQIHNDARLRGAALDWRPDERRRAVAVIAADLLAWEARAIDNPILLAAAARYGGDPERAQKALDRLAT